MFKDEVALIRFLGREFIAMFNVFFLFPLLIVFVLISVINGVIWNVLLGIAFTCLVFLILFRILIHFLYKNGRKSIGNKCEKRMKLNTLLLNNKFILYCNNFFHFAVL